MTNRVKALFRLSLPMSPERKLCEVYFILVCLLFSTQIGEGDRKALEIISVVGCSISLLAVLITMAVTLFFWRVMKSPRSKVLLNLCTAIAASCTLVIFEGLARNTVCLSRFSTLQQNRYDITIIKTVNRLLQR